MKSKHEIYTKKRNTKIKEAILLQGGGVLGSTEKEEKDDIFKESC